MLRNVPLFGVGNKGKSSNVSAQERVNLFVEIPADPEANGISLFPMPGTTTFVNFGANPSRGFYVKGNVAYVVNGSTLWEVAADGTTTSRGTLNSTGGRVDITDNGTQMLIVDGTDGYIFLFSPTAQTISTITRVGTLATLTTAAAHGLMTGMQVTVAGATPSQYNGTYTITVTGATTFTYVMASDPGSSAAPVGSYTIASAFAQITDADFPASTTCAFLNGYFIVQETDSARFYISASYDGSSWDALDFATAESDPDNLVRVFVENGLVVLFGEKTTEFWGDSGAADFPFARIGASAIEWGLAARWSLAKFDSSLIFLRRNKLGAVQVCRMVGNDAVPVSNPEIDYIFSTYSAVENATGFSFMVSGHPMYQINFPTPNESWVYDGKSNEWHRAQYGASGRHRGELQANFLNRPYVTDYENGKLYLLDQDVYTDDGTYIVREFVTRHNKTGDFSRIPQLWLEMEAGVGLNSGQGSDPQVMLQISRDGGHTWGAEVWRGIGAIGQYRARAVWNALGRARDWLFKFRVTDPVKTVFVAAWAKVER
jgi:hypothetical protein